MSSWRDTCTKNNAIWPQKTCTRSHNYANCDPENLDSLSLVVLCTLCCVARDSRSKATYNNVVDFVPDNCDSQAVAAEIQQPQPLLVVEGRYSKPHKVAEGTSVLQGQVKNAVALLL